VAFKKDSRPLCYSDQVIDGILYVEVAGKAGGSVNPRTNFGLGNVAMKGTKTRYLMLWYLSTEQGRFPLDSQFGEMKWEVISSKDSK
jgi:hypothetical protein